MNEFQINMDGGSTIRLPTAGKYCDRDILVTAEGGAELNIAFGETPPEDTTKLWVKTDKPNRVVISPTCDETEIEGVDAQKMSRKLPVYNERMCCGAIGNKIYMFGGNRTSYYSNPSSYCYDLESDSIVALPSDLKFPKINTGGKGVVVGKKIYMFGGYDTSGGSVSTDIWCFDEDEMTLKTIGVMPNPLYDISCAMVDNIVYIIGGMKGGSASNGIYTFDTNSHEIGEFPVGLVASTCRAGVAVIGTNIYVMGGTSTTVQCIDTLDKTVVSVGALTHRAYGGTAIALGSKILVFGGQEQSNKSPKNTILRYDTITNDCTLENETLDTGLSNAGSVAIDGNLYLLGGATSITGTVNTIYCVSFILPAYIVNNGELFVKFQTNRATYNLMDLKGVELNLPLHSAYKGNTENIGKQVEMMTYNGESWVTI